MRTDPGREAAYEANKKLERDRLVNASRSTTDAVESLTAQVSEIRESIVEVRDMLKTLVGIYSLQNRGASGEYNLRKAYEKSSMSNRAKQKGTAFETLVRQYLNDSGFPDAQRTVLKGGKDTGDINGIRNPDKRQVAVQEPEVILSEPVA